MDASQGKFTLIDCNDLGAVSGALLEYDGGGSYKKPRRIYYDDLSTEGAVYLMWATKTGWVVKQIQ